MTGEIEGIVVSDNLNVPVTESNASATFRVIITIRAVLRNTVYVSPTVCRRVALYI